jgi:hypothetical protein
MRDFIAHGWDNCQPDQPHFIYPQSAGAPCPRLWDMGNDKPQPSCLSLPISYTTPPQKISRYVEIFCRLFLRFCHAQNTESEKAPKAQPGSPASGLCWLGWSCLNGQSIRAFLFHPAAQIFFGGLPLRFCKSVILQTTHKFF